MRPPALTPVTCPGTFVGRVADTSRPTRHGLHVTADTSRRGVIRVVWVRAGATLTQTHPQAYAHCERSVERRRWNSVAHTEWELGVSVA